MKSSTEKQVPQQIAAPVQQQLQTRQSQVSAPQAIANQSPQIAQLHGYQAIAQGAQSGVQAPVAQGGLPSQLQQGIESLSGIAMHDVRVHYNSSKPAQLQAHAYAQGTDIHIAPGQERHLPHEAWHVVQQKQGRVKPTLQLKGVAINDDSALEREADLMGGRAMHKPASPRLVMNTSMHSAVQRQAVAQRIIVIEGKEYGAAAQASFEAKFNQKHQAAILSAMIDLPHYPKNITDALADERHFQLTFLEDDPEFGISYSAEANAPVKKSAIGNLREAGERPETIVRPKDGFEQIDISGLIMCIGIVVEAKSGQAVQAATGTHFVTPESIDAKGNLNAHGASHLDLILRQTSPNGKLTATLCHSASAKGINPNSKSASMDAMRAINAIVDYFVSHGVQKVSINETASKISYRLAHDGSSMLRW